MSEIGKRQNLIPKTSEAGPIYFSIVSAKCRLRRDGRVSNDILGHTINFLSLAKFSEDFIFIPPAADAAAFGCFGCLKIH